MLPGMVSDSSAQVHEARAPEVVSEDAQLLAALRSGDERAFVMLVEQYHMSLVRLAQTYVSSYAVAEEVAQETWLGVLQGLHRFEERSSLKTWLFHILTNRAKTRGQREGRSIPFSDLWHIDDEPSEPAVEPERFRAAEPWLGHWASPPQRWNHVPEERLLSQETRAHIDAAIAALPSTQRLVVMLRDIEGLSSGEVCDMLGVTESNQRVLLHRARSRVRAALEQYFSEA
ncbi:MAG TPA: sigma-70 family RNA polymerase sigma factor [Herpetosiphonaceae bacterium]